MEGFVSELRRLGRVRGESPVIYLPNFEKKPRGFMMAHEKDRLQQDEMYRATIAGLVYDHLFRKVRIADACFIFNQNGYIGVNTAGELFAAAALGKPVYALDDRVLMGTYPNDLYEEPSPRKLIHEIISTPEELLELLC